MDNVNFLSALRANFDPNVLGGLDLEPLLDEWVNDATLNVEKVSKDPDGKHVRIAGTSACFGLPRVVTEVILDQPRSRTDGSNANLVVLFHMDSASGTSGWRFSTTFPSLPMAAGANAPLIDAVTFRSATLMLSTGAWRDPVDGVTVVRGLSFAGTVANASVAGLPVPIAGMLAFGTLTPDRTGVPRQLFDQFPWDVDPPVPGVSLAIPLGGGFGIGRITMAYPTLRLYSPLTSDWTSRNRSYRPTIGITGNVPIKDDASIRVTAELDESGQLILTGDGGDLKLQDLGDIAGLTGRGGMLSGLPDSIREPVRTADDLRLQSVSLGGTLSDKSASFDFAALRVGYPDLDFPVWSKPPLKVEALSVEFSALDPLGRQREVNAAIIGTLSLAGIPLEVYSTVPHFTLCANLPDGVTLPLNALFNALSLPAPPDLRVNTLQLFLVPGTLWELTCTLAEDPGWTLDLGVLKLTAEAISIDISKPTNGSATASFSGKILLWDEITLDIAYSVPGAFSASARLPTIHLSDLWKRLSGIGIDLPFDDVELDQPYAAITIEEGNYSFIATTIVAALGEIALSSRKTDKATGLAAGIVIDDANASTLSFIREILDAVGLEKLVLVISSLDDPGFSFPELAQFDAPGFAGKGVTLPTSANGVVKGVNLYARLLTANDKGLGAILALFKLPVNGTLDVTLSISTPNPQAKSKLFLSFTSNRIGLDFTGELGLLVNDGILGAFVDAKTTTSIQGNDVTFDVSAAVFETGALLSGTMEGKISFGPVHLTDLALLLGVDFAGAPSLGFATQLDVANFDSSIAIFLDSVDPRQSMFAGAVSDLTLADVIRVFTSASIPSELTSVLSTLALKGMESFDVPADGLVDALNNQDHAQIAGALNPHDLNLGGKVDSCHVIVAERGKRWFIAHRGRDGKNRPLPHYELAFNAEAKTVTCKLEPQVYFALQDTSIGILKFDAGTYLAAELDNVLLKAKLDIDIDTGRGIAADVDLDKIQLFSSDFLAITDSSDDSGPHLSLATFSQPEESDPNRRGPHLIIDGKLRMLGIDVSSTKLTLGADGMAFVFSEKGAFGELSLSGVIDTHNLSKMHGEGDATFGFDRQLSGGPLGDLHVQATIGGSLAVDLNGGQPALTLAGQIAFMGLSVSLPSVTLSTSLFGDIPEKIEKFVEQAIYDHLKQMLGVAGGALEIAKAMASGLGAEVKDVVPLLKNIGAGAGDIANAISGVFQLQPDKVARALIDLAGLSVTEVATALKVGLNLAADGVAAALNTAGVATDQIAGALNSAFGYAADAVASVLSRIGLPGDQIAGALKNAFNMTVDGLASVLKNTLGYSADAARTILTGVGYAADQVEAALGDAWDWAKDHFNPSNW